MSTPDPGESTTRTLDPINPYAVISLIAALLGLFPIAIVFGVLAFTRPAGRGIAIAGLVLGIIELAAVIVVYYGFTNAFSDDSSDNAAASYSISTSDFATTTDVPTTSSTTPAPAPAPPTTDTPIATEETTPTVEIGDYCTTKDAQAATADGSTAYCSRRAGTDAYLWAPNPGVIPNPDLPAQTAPTAPIAPTAIGPSPGDDCTDPDATATDSEGRSIFCNPTVNGRNPGNLVWQLQP